MDEFLREQINAPAPFLGFNDLGYSLLTWIDQGQEYEAYFMLGYGGQYVYIVPELDLVVGMFAQWQNLGTANADQNLVRNGQFIQNEILPRM